MKGNKNMKGSKNMGKKKYFVIALLIAVGVSIRYVAGTYAKYTSTITGSGTATVAKWAFTDDNSSTALTFNLTTTVDQTSLINGKIAPGTEGNFQFTLSNATSDVGVEFTVSFAGATNVPSNLVLKYNNTSFDPTSATITGTIARGESITIPIAWEWPYYTNTTDDGEDTDDGVAAATMTLSASITGVQTNPTQAITTTATVTP